MSENENSTGKLGSGERHLSFSLGGEGFAIPLLSVKEVIALPETTPVPHTPSYFIGIMNLRGQVISVLDLRDKLGLKADRTEETAVIICEFGDSPLGVVVDSVDSVLTPLEDDISEKPDIDGGTKSDYITAIYRKDDHLILFLDIERTLESEDYEAIRKAQSFSKMKNKD